MVFFYIRYQKSTFFHFSLLIIIVTHPCVTILPSWTVQHTSLLYSILKHFSHQGYLCSKLTIFTQKFNYHGSKEPWNRISYDSMCTWGCFHAHNTFDMPSQGLKLTFMELTNYSTKIHTNKCMFGCRQIGNHAYACM